MRRLHRFIRFQYSTNELLAMLATLAADSMVYLAGGLLVGAGSLALLPLYTRTLTTAEFGGYALVDVTMMIAVTVAQLGLGVSYLKWYAETDMARHGTLLASSLVCVAATSICGGAFVSSLIMTPVGERWLGPDRAAIALMVAPTVFLEALYAVLMTDMRARRLSKAYSGAMVLRTAVLVGGSFVLMVHMRAGLEGLFMARLLADLVGIALLALFVGRLGRARMSWAVVVPMVRYGIPLVWSGFMWQLMDGSVRYILGQFGTLEDVGRYTACIKITGLFTMLLTQPFGITWGGHLFQIAKRPNARVLYTMILGLVVAGSSAFGVVIALFGPYLIETLAGTPYLPAAGILPVLLLVRVIQVIDYPVSVGAYLSAKTREMAVIWSLGLGISLVCGYILTRMFGAMGAAWAWLAGEVAICLLLAWLGQARGYRIKYEAGSFLFMLCMGGVYLLAKDLAHGSFAAASGISIGVVLMMALYALLHIRRSPGAGEELGDARSFSI